MAGKFRPLKEGLKDSADSFAHHVQRTVDLPKKHRTKVDDDLNRRTETDQSLAGGTPKSKPTPDVQPHRPASMSPSDYQDVLDRSVHNPDAPEAVLGKFWVEGTPSYVEAAEGRVPPATYFSLGTEWDDIATRSGLDDEGMFDAFNIPFLDRLIGEGKDIHFSHDPNDFPGSALAKELEYLQSKGYVFDPSTMQAFLP